MPYRLIRFFVTLLAMTTSLQFWLTSTAKGAEDDSATAFRRMPESRAMTSAEAQQVTQWLAKCVSLPYKLDADHSAAVTDISGKVSAYTFTIRQPEEDSRHKFTRIGAFQAPDYIFPGGEKINYLSVIHGWHSSEAMFSPPPNPKNPSWPVHEPTAVTRRLL